MQLLANAKQYDWATWLIGFWRAIIGGASNSVISSLVGMGVAPDTFNFSKGLRHTLTMIGVTFLGSAVVHMFIYLQTHAAPEPIVEAPKP